MPNERRMLTSVLPLMVLSIFEPGQCHFCGDGVGIDGHACGVLACGEFGFEPVHVGEFLLVCLWDGHRQFCAECSTQCYEVVHQCLEGSWGGQNYA